LWRVGELGVSVMAFSCHQSISVTRCSGTPEARNHFLSREGTKKCASGWVLVKVRMVG
jgi:hypothetical protein